MIQKITQNNWNFWTVNLIVRAKKLLTIVRFFGTPYRLVPSQKSTASHHAESSFHKHILGLDIDIIVQPPWFSIRFFVCRLMLPINSSLCFLNASFAMPILVLMSISHLPSCYPTAKVFILWYLFQGVKSLFLHRACSNAVLLTVILQGIHSLFRWLPWSLFSLRWSRCRYQLFSGRLPEESVLHSHAKILDFLRSLVTARWS